MWGCRGCGHNSAMGRRKAERTRSRGPLALAVVALAAIVVSSGALMFWPDTGGESGIEPATAPTGSTAPLDVSRLPIPRTLDCNAIDDDALVTALGGPVLERVSYDNGDRTELGPTYTDVAHEAGCVFDAGDTQARVWVFAAPMSTPDARDLVREARRTRGCTTPDDATAFGTPRLTTVCQQRRPEPALVTTMRGLFDDAWLSCELTVEGAEGRGAVHARTDRWCVHVVTTLGAQP